MVMQVVMAHARHGEAREYGERRGFVKWFGCTAPSSG